MTLGEPWTNDVLQKNMSTCWRYHEVLHKKLELKKMKCCWNKSCTKEWWNCSTILHKEMLRCTKRIFNQLNPVDVIKGLHNIKYKSNVEVVYKSSSWLIKQKSTKSENKSWVLHQSVSDSCSHRQQLEWKLLSSEVIYQKKIFFFSSSNLI